mmetsp:Transcript_49617/g.116060  ORF Transcript_49617/g.116060 Transcript_49617/m.116060 type:complete len:110 (-) Transcript_49617:402-731(-)
MSGELQDSLKVPDVVGLRPPRTALSASAAKDPLERKAGDASVGSRDRWAIRLERPGILAPAVEDGSASQLKKLWALERAAVLKLLATWVPVWRLGVLLAVDALAAEARL